MTWLNQKTCYALYNLTKAIAPPSHRPLQEQDPFHQWETCVAFHIRWTDATSEKQHPCNFYPLQAYIDGAKQVTYPTEGGNIVLLTNDDSTIHKAHILHLEYNWLYIDCVRYYGAQELVLSVG